MWIVAVRVMLVGSFPNGFLTCPVEVIDQFWVVWSKTPLNVAVPPSKSNTYGAQVSPSRGAPAGLGGAVRQRRLRVQEVRIVGAPRVAQDGGRVVDRGVGEIVRGDPVLRLH